MKRRPKSNKNPRPAPDHAARLIDKPPVAYLAPGALAALTQGRGLLLGAQRPGWVDLRAYEPHPRANCRELVALRFEDPPEWDVVGVVLPKSDLERRREFLVRELVPGDIVLALTGEYSLPQVFVNLGDEWAPAPLKMSRSGRATSARRRRR